MLVVCLRRLVVIDLQVCVQNPQANKTSLSAQANKTSLSLQANKTSLSPQANKTSLPNPQAELLRKLKVLVF